MITIDTLTLRALPDTIDLTLPPRAGPGTGLFQLDWVVLPHERDPGAAIPGWAVSPSIPIAFLPPCAPAPAKRSGHPGSVPGTGDLAVAAARARRRAR